MLQPSANLGLEPKKNKCDPCKWNCELAKINQLKILNLPDTQPHSTSLWPLLDADTQPVPPVPGCRESQQVYDEHVQCGEDYVRMQQSYLALFNQKKALTEQCEAEERLEREEEEEYLRAVSKLREDGEELLARHARLRQRTSDGRSDAPPALQPSYPQPYGSHTQPCHNHPQAYHNPPQYSHPQDMRGNYPHLQPPHNSRYPSQENQLSAPPQPTTAPPSHYTNATPSHYSNATPTRYTNNGIPTRYTTTHQQQVAAHSQFCPNHTQQPD